MLGLNPVIFLFKLLNLLLVGRWSSLVCFIVSLGGGSVSITEIYLRQDITGLFKWLILNSKQMIQFEGMSMENS